MTNEQLVSLIKEGIDTSDNMLQLWEQNRGFINKMAFTYRGYEDIEDLKQQGYLGLCQAVEGYRPEENVPFINYAAFWIRQSMSRYVEDCGGIVRIPSCEQRQQRRYKKFIHDFETWAGRKPTDREICYYMQIEYKVLEKIKNNAIMEQIGSLDSNIGEEGENMVIDMIPADVDVEGSVLDEVEKEELKQVLWSVVDDLPDNQPHVIRSIYQENKTLEATGKTIGVSKEHTRIIRDKALRNLRRTRRRYELIVFLPEAMGSMAYRHNGLKEFNRTWTSSTEFAALKLYEETT